MINSKNRRRKVCVVTGSRADYGLLYCSLKRIAENKKLELQLLVTGMHLLSEFGSTYKQIEKDGFKISRKIKCLKSSDTPFAISNSIAQAISGFSKAYKELQPDILLVVGDRFESFAAVAAAQAFCIPVAHCHGGELTYGAIDEAFRHAMTKMSHLHFVSTKQYQKRVIQLGENPSNVYLSGALSLENLQNIKLLNKQELADCLGISFSGKIILITYHPETINHSKASEQIKQLLKALTLIQDACLIFTLPNADTGGRVIIKLIKQFVAKNKGRAHCFRSLGSQRYMSLLAQVDLVLGNSSSGIIEAPSFFTPTVNIGLRQAGRVRAKSVIDCGPVSEEITAAINKALSMRFKKSLKNMKNPYDFGSASSLIVSKIATANLDRLLIKKFHDT